ncbi:MAG TPA: hypothetical protein PKA53_07935 [Sphingobacterium sp.]|nr:hypothetical protein [Sphingobacterium sp.]
MKTKSNKETYKVNNPNVTVAEEAAIAYRSFPYLRKLDIRDDYTLVKKAKEGVNTNVFYSLADAINMPEKTLASIINLSPRTISNYRDQNKHLDANYSEHLLKLINLYQFGKEIFGDFGEFDLWLKRPFWDSEDRPIDFISTSGGVDLVYEEIEKLAFGYPV